MATEIRPDTGPGSFEYVPGQSTKSGLFCVQAGDRITFSGWKFKNFNPGVSDVRPDSDGYLPHFSIRPRYVRDAGIGSSSIAEMRRQFGVPLSGNIDNFPFIRVDLGSVWFPFAAEVKIDGGDGPGPEFGTLLITIEWERQRWHVNSSTTLYEIAAMFAANSPAEHFAQIAQSLFSDSAIPVIEKRDEKNTFTIFNVPANIPISRPTNALKVFSPSDAILRLSNGTGTYSANIRTGYASAVGESTPLGPFSVITPLSNIDLVTFTVQL